MQNFLSISQIDFRYNESTARETIRVDSFESNRIDNIFNPPCIDPGRCNFKDSRKSTSGITNRQQGKRFVSIRQHFQPTLYRPGKLYFLSPLQIDFRHNESTAGEAIRVDSIESSRIDNIFNPPCIDPGSYIF